MKEVNYLKMNYFSSNIDFSKLMNDEHISEKTKPPYGNIYKLRYFIQLKNLKILY